MKPFSNVSRPGVSVKVYIRPFVHLASPLFRPRTLPFCSLLTLLSSTRFSHDRQPAAVLSCYVMLSVSRRAYFSYDLRSVPTVLDVLNFPLFFPSFSLSFLPSSSPLSHSYPHLTPFSSLFLPLFCCYIKKMRHFSRVSYMIFYVPTSS